MKYTYYVFLESRSVFCCPSEIILSSSLVKKIWPMNKHERKVKAASALIQCGSNESEKRSGSPVYQNCNIFKDFPVIIKLHHFASFNYFTCNKRNIFVECKIIHPKYMLVKLKWHINTFFMDSQPFFFYFC